jgi:hypothetical protein
MRLVLALTIAAIAVGALALTGSSVHQRPVPRARLLSASAECSAAARCVEGCALPVANSLRPRSPTSPCAKQAQSGCPEYVAGLPALHPSAGPPALHPEATCAGSSPAYSERLLSPRALHGLRQRSERTLRERDLKLFRQRSERALRKHAR